MRINGVKIHNDFKISPARYHWIKNLCLGIFGLRTLRRYRFGYAVSTIFMLIGLMAVMYTVWNAWPQIESSNTPLDAFWTFIWTEEISIGLGIYFKAVYLIILASLAFVAAFAVLIYSRQWLFLPSQNRTLQCPFCKRRWKSTYDRGQILCPHCRHLVHPKLVRE